MDNELRVFNSNRLNRWLGQKHQELCIVKRFQEEAKLKINDQKKVLFFPSARTLREQMTKVPVEFGFEISFSFLARSESFLESLNRRITEGKRNEVNGKLWYENNSVIERIEKEIVIFAELVNAKSNDEKFAFAMTAPDKYNETCATQYSIIVLYKQKRIFGWDAVLKVCQHYPKERIVDVFRLVFEHFERKKMIDVIRLLVEEVIPEKWNPFPLLALCRYYDKKNLIDIVCWLFIEKNIDVNCRTSGGWNALTLLCRNYHQENLIDIVRLLIQKNIDVNCQSKYGWTALPLLCQNYNKDNLIDIVRLLLAKNVNVNCMHFGGWNALHYLCDRAPKIRGLVDLVQLLIQHNIDKNVMTGSGSRKFLAYLFTSSHYVRETPRSLLLKRFNEDEVRDVLQILDS